MALFEVCYTETIQYEIRIEAESREVAEQKIKTLDYEPGESTQIHPSCVDIDDVREI